MFFFTLTFWNLQLDTEEEKKWMLLCLECIQNSLVFFFFRKKGILNSRISLPCYPNIWFLKNREDYFSTAKIHETNEILPFFPLLYLPPSYVLMPVLLGHINTTGIN